MVKTKWFSIFSFFLFLLFPLVIEAAQFCSYKKNTNYFPHFQINNQFFIPEIYGRITCGEIKDNLQNKSLKLTTNGFNVNYQGNIEGFNLKNQKCGKKRPCLIPTTYQNKNLDYIFVSIWEVPDGKITGALNAIYR